VKTTRTFTILRFFVRYNDSSLECYMNCLHCSSVLVESRVLTTTVCLTSSHRPCITGRRLTPAHPEMQLHKVYLYRPLVMSVLLYSAETWTLLVADLRKIESFHTKCLRQLICVNWRDQVNSSSVPQQTDWSDENHQLSQSSSLVTFWPRCQAGCMSTSSHPDA